MKISVTKEHIKKGKPTFPSACPIALALKDAGFTTPIVIDTFMREEEADIYYDLPRSCSRFIRRFDTKKSVKPFNFILKEAPWFRSLVLRQLHTQSA
jgi:hypothetical protein